MLKSEKHQFITDEFTFNPIANPSLKSSVVTASIIDIDFLSKKKLGPRGTRVLSSGFKQKMLKVIFHEM